MFAKIHPTKLGKPVRVMARLLWPWGIALNSKQQLVVTKCRGEKVTVFDRGGKKVQTITSEKFSRPVGVAVDLDDNIYVSNFGNSSLLKFSKEGKLMKVVGQKGTQPREFSQLSLIKVINNKLYTCDRGNNRFQVLNTELEYVGNFGRHGDGDGPFRGPNDIAQDRAGNLYVADTNNNLVHIFDYSEQYLSTFSKRVLLPNG